MRSITILCIVLIIYLALLFRKRTSFVKLLERATKIQLEENRCYECIDDGKLAYNAIYRFNADYCVIAGDIRGCLPSLLICIDKYKSFKKKYPSAHIIFLGDYVGGGICSVECLECLLRLKLQDPLYVHLLRGNHEDVEMWLIDEPAERSVYPELRDRYGDERANTIYKAVGAFYASLPPIAIINNNILCCHGMINDKVKKDSKIKLTPTIINNKFLSCITWSNYPAPVCEMREYGRSCGDITPRELLQKCNELRITKLIKGHDYSGAGNALYGSGVEVHIVNSSLWKLKRTPEFYIYTDSTSPPTKTKRTKPVLPNCLFLRDNIISTSPFLECQDQIYMYLLSKRMQKEFGLSLEQAKQAIDEALRVPHSL